MVNDRPTPHFPMVLYRKCQAPYYETGIQDLGTETVLMCKHMASSLSPLKMGERVYFHTAREIVFSNMPQLIRISA